MLKKGEEQSLFLDAWDAKREEERRRSGPSLPSAEITIQGA
jgi:hypothetical protein